MMTGINEATLHNLNQEFQLTYLDELIEQKVSKTEKVTISNLTLEFNQQEYKCLLQNLENAVSSSQLPISLSIKLLLSDFLICLLYVKLNKNKETILAFLIYFFF